MPFFDFPGKILSLALPDHQSANSKNSFLVQKLRSEVMESFILLSNDIWGVIFTSWVDSFCKSGSVVVSGLRSIDLVCKNWKKLNYHTGWKTFWVNFIKIPENWYSDLKYSELTFWMTAFRQIFPKNPNPQFGDGASNLSILLKKYQLVEGFQINSDLKYFLVFWSIYNFRSITGVFTTIQLDLDSEENSDSFLFLGSCSLGGGDTNWWLYLSLKETVRCPKAYKKWGQDRKGETTLVEKNKKYFGPGSIVVFSLWNHSSDEYPSEYVPPSWGEVDGYTSKHERVCDEWIKTCVEHPHPTYSHDSLPCAWGLRDFIQEIIKTEFEFSISIRSTPAKKGDELFLLGSIPELGNWDVNRAKKMVRIKKEFWVYQLSLSQNSIPFEYKYVLKKVDGTIIPEILSHDTRKILNNSERIHRDEWQSYSSFRYVGNQKTPIS
jgi:hypothetical protein